MCHSPIVFGTLRTAVEDVEVTGYGIPAGTLVILNSAAANRDSAVCGEPDRLDITRTAALPMQTFGGGVHYCPPWKPLSGLSGPATLPVEFEAGF